MEKVLVTGGAGFIGGFLVDKLVERSFQVVCLDSLEQQVHHGRKPDYLNPRCEYIWGRCDDHSAVRKALENTSVVFHLAAIVGVGQSMYEIERYTVGNTLSTAVLAEEIIQANTKPRKIIVASSMSIYGEGAYRNKGGRIVYPPLRNLEQLQQGAWEMLDSETGETLKPTPTTEDKPLMPSSVYAIGKRDQEEMFHVLGRAYGFPSVAFRFFNVFGSRQALSNPYTGVAAIFSSRLLKGLQPIIFEDGEQLRDFVHVSDVVQGLLLGLDSERANYETFNIGSGKPITIKAVCKALSRFITKGSVEPLITGQYRLGDIRHCFADITKASKLLGYRPNYDFETGVPELVEWVQKQQVDKDRFAAPMEEAKQKAVISFQKGPSLK